MDQVANWLCSPLPFVSDMREVSDGDPKGSDPALISALYLHLQMLRRRVGGTLRRSDSQQAVKSPPLLVSVKYQYPSPQACLVCPSEVSDTSASSSPGVT